MPAGAPEGNKNAEKWTIEEATKLFNDALEMSLGDDYDFIGEIAKELGTYRNFLNVLTGKFPELETIHNQILGNLEANCFLHSKKGTIKEATAIVNLKSNYQWTDRKEIKHELQSGFINLDPLADDPTNTGAQEASKT